MTLEDRLNMVYANALEELVFRVSILRDHSPANFNYYNPYWNWLCFNGRIPA